ncbi:MAG TPA: hypothetical protein VGL86_22890 [Polyangia bacterium]
MRAVALALLITVGAGVANAQGVPPPPVPQLPDEPLPEWHPPKQTNRRALFLQMSPEMRDDQRLRQIGIWMSSLGWAALLLGGVFYVWAANVNQDLANPPPPMTPGVFSPALEDKRNAVETSALTFLGIGGVLAVTGFALYTAGQWRMTVHHKKHLDEPLPPLSGF